MPTPLAPRRRTVLLLAAAAALSACAGAVDASSQHGLIGAPAPSFTAEVVTGRGPTSLVEARGKVVIVDFWATFCGPCKRSFPKYQQLVDAFGGDVVVLAVSIDEPENASKAELQAFAKETGVTFPLLWDKDHSVVARYAPPTMPTSFVLDRSGVVRHVHAGFKPGEEAEIAAEVRALLAR